MSVFNHKKAISSIEFKGFEGICTTAPHKHVPSAADIVNFRVLEDGSLEKRCGFACIADCEAEIRAVWSGQLNGKQSTFIVYKNKVGRVDTVSKELVTIGTIGSESGDAKFILFKSNLFVMDDYFFYKITADSITPTEAYAPLYGKLWGIAKRGTVYEPVNLATRHIRMSYRVDEKLIYLCVDHKISSIDGVYINGEQVTDKSRYYFDLSLMSVCVMGLELGQVVDLYLTVEPEEIDLLRLRSCKQFANLGGYTETNLYFWDGKDEGVVYQSRDVGEGSLWSSSYVYGETIPLYVPSDSSFSIDDEKRKIKAVCRHYDRLLVFTDENTWMIPNDSESTNILSGGIMVNSSQGCTSNGAALTCLNDPICISDGAILKWTADTDELNECNAYSISESIEPFLKPSFYRNAKILLNKKRAELLFYDPFDDAEVVWIYNYKIESWYKIDGIDADEIFVCDDNLGFVKDSAVYIFDETLKTDLLGNGVEREIVAIFESHPIDLNVYSNNKRLSGMALNASFGGGSIRAEYTSDSRIIGSITLKDDSSYPKSFLKRLNSPRFSYLTLRLTALGDAIQRIYSTSIWTKL